LYKYEDAWFEAEYESVRHFWLRPKSENAEVQKYVDRIMQGLGVQVVWCADLPDMRCSIRELKEKGCVCNFGRQPIAS